MADLSWRDPLSVGRWGDGDRTPTYAAVDGPRWTEWSAVDCAVTDRMSDDRRSGDRKSDDRKKPTAADPAVDPGPEETDVLGLGPAR